jgi:hypothetical protein
MATTASQELDYQARDFEDRAVTVRDEADRTARDLEDQARLLRAQAREVEVLEDNRNAALAEADAIDRATR